MAKKHIQFGTSGQYSEHSNGFFYVFPVYDSRNGDFQHLEFIVVPESAYIGRDMRINWQRNTRSGDSFKEWYGVRFEYSGMRIEMFNFMARLVRRIKKLFGTSDSSPLQIIKALESMGLSEAFQHGGMGGTYVKKENWPTRPQWDVTDNVHHQFITSIFANEEEDAKKVFLDHRCVDSIEDYQFTCRGVQTMPKRNDF